MFFAGLDIGTTRMKCGVYGKDGGLLFETSRDYGELQRGKEYCLDIETVQQNVRALLKEAYAAAPFSSVAFSSLGESFVLLDGQDNVLFPPMLYTDGRGAEQAERFSSRAEQIFKICGVYPNGMYSAYKLLWLKENEPALFTRAEKVMLVGEYISYLLTGVRACDYSSAARTGLFDVRAKKFSRELCDLFGLDSSLFSPAVPTGAPVGKIKPEILREWNAEQEVLLVAGGHDQVCAALGAGAVECGACADGMGTVECLTVSYAEPSDCADMGRCGYPNVPYIDGLYCTYLLNFSCGSLVRWWLKSLFPQEKIADGSAFASLEKDFREGPTGLLVLPYFAGAATPFQDSYAKGGILNLQLSDTPADVYKGILEGLCFEMRLNLERCERYGIKPKKLIATGGGSASRAWLQIKADITGLPVEALECKEAGVCGAAILGAAALTGEGLGSIASRFVKTKPPVLPRAEQRKTYDKIYEKYKTVYQTLKEYM